jgi:hypothetical protein
VIRRLIIAVALGGALLALGRQARAQVIAEPAPPPWPDPKKFAKGPFASGELGALVYVGRSGKYAGPGPAFGVRLGYDLFRWLALQAHVMGASAEATLPAPTAGQSFQTLLYAGEARLSVAIRRFALFAEGGAAAAQIASNVLDSVNVTQGNRLSFAVVAGGGLDYHTLNRHFSVGVGLDYVWMQAFNSSSALSIDAYLRYTR